MNPTTAWALRRAYTRMRRRFGHQRWWPGETPFEVCVGAILVQNTSWTNVERTMSSLRLAGWLEPHTLLALPETRLAELLRPTGYFNVKARRLRAFLAVLVHDCDGRLEQLLGGPLPAARERLLAIPGIGPETADSMLLYAGGQASFVVDAYTRRIFTRHGWCAADADYRELQAICVTALSHRPEPERLDYWGDYHAQLVAVGKDYCRPREPRCHECPLRSLLPAPATPVKASRDSR